jgi:hypothetical protein
MKINWETIANKVGTLRKDGSELYFPQHSSAAFEEILGDEFVQHAIDTFINGDKGNELAIKTIRCLRSKKAADYAYKIFTENKITNALKARTAIWAMNDILHPVCLQYANEFLDDPQYAYQAVSLIKELIYNCHQDFTETELNTILSKARKVTDANAIEIIDAVTNFLATENKSHAESAGIQHWYMLLQQVQKRPAMYGIQSVEDIFLFCSGYAMALHTTSTIDADLEHFTNGFTQFVIDDYNAPSHCNWCTTIRLYSTSHSNSVDIFFEELAKYKSGETDFDRIKYREENKIFCCQQMADKIAESTDGDGAIKYNNADVIINKWGNGTYGIPIHDGGSSVIEITYCPWCGTKLKA